MKDGIKLTVFSKPWRQRGLEDLAKHVKELGFAGVELPVRSGFQVSPENVERGLPEAQRIFHDQGLEITSVAGEMSREMIEACGEAKVSILRTMVPIDLESGYIVSVNRFRKSVEEIHNSLRNSGVILGVQNHCGDFVGSASGLMECLDPLDKTVVKAVLDLGHTALSGEPSRYAIEIAWPALVMVNLKNARWVPEGYNSLGERTWKRQWVKGREGLASWSEIAALLKNRGYQGPICLTAEYRNDQDEVLSGESVDPLIREDSTHAHQLLG